MQRVADAAVDLDSTQGEVVKEVLAAHLDQFIREVGLEATQLRHKVTK